MQTGRQPYQASGYPGAEPHPQMPNRGYQPAASQREMGHHASFAPPPPAPKKSKVVPILLALVIVLAVGVTSVLILRQRGVLLQSHAHAAELREATNRYRVASASAQKSGASTYRALSAIAGAFAGTENMQFYPEEPTSPFVDNAEDEKFTEVWDALTVGRLVIPSIGSNGPLASEATNETLLTGFGIFSAMKDMSEQGQTVILGHRCLTKTTSMFYMEEMEEGHPFYVDDYRIGRRYIYQAKFKEEIAEADLPAKASPADGYEVVKGQSCMLDTCTPRIYADSSHRILVYGTLIKITDIPRDDQFYQRYLSEQGLEAPVPEGEKVIGQLTPVSESTSSNEANAETPAEAEPNAVPDAPSEETAPQA